MVRSILCLDIGSGTQDALLFYPERELENCPKFVLPTPARLVAQRLDEMAASGRDVYLHGRNMGGGFYRTMKRFLAAGRKVAIHPQAALSLSDDPSWLAGLGVVLTEECPRGFCPLHLADFEPGFWRAFLGMAGLEYPDLVLAAAQDHGFHPGMSNRLGRFNLWRKFLDEDGGRLERLVYQKAPGVFTRLACLQESTGGGPVADTGAAAVLGTLFDPSVERLSREQGVLLVNVGNSHVLGFLLFQDRVHGVFEHHTGCLPPEELWAELDQFRSGVSFNEKVLAEGGHGVYIQDLPVGAGGFKPTIVIGPRRRLLSGFEVVFPAPGGDMMLSGAFGLLKGLSLIDREFAAVLKKSTAGEKRS